MKILITGAGGFIGKNLVAELKNQGYKEIFLCTRHTPEEEFLEYVRNCNFVVHLAGENRPQEPEGFRKGNVDFTEYLVKELEKNHNYVPILLSSSIQATQENLYGKSKKEAECIIREYGNKHQVEVMIYRLPNIFGKWGRPNYNSVVATFCYNISRNLEVRIDNRENVIQLVYIDDVIDEFIKSIKGTSKSQEGFYVIPTSYNASVGGIVDAIYSFKESRSDLLIPNMGDEFTKKLYSTYLSYIPPNDFSYPLKMNIDERGSFTEFIRTLDRGQVSINISKPGITKGNHWHHSKNEKFLVVKGKGCVQFRQVDSDKVFEYHVSGSKLEVIDIPTGYTHNIINEGDEELVTIMWANEMYDHQKPDTYFLKV